MHRSVKDMKGKTFGRLTVLRDSGRRCQKKVIWVCLCLCGNLTEVVGTNLRRGITRSCGCLSIDMVIQRRFKHGENHSNSRLYRIWASMKRRCDNPNREVFYRYGGRGIKVCDEWQEYIPFREWALANGYEDNLTIDRIDNNGNYESNNCQFITRSENSKKYFREKQNA